MPYSRFLPQPKLPAVGNKLKGDILVQLAGLDQVTPMELLKDGKTPDAKNFRLYAQSEAGREVAVSTRKGPGFYVEPLSEALKQSQTTLAGAVVDLVIPNILAEMKTMSWSGVITKLDLNLTGGDGILRVDLYDDNDGKPGQLLSESSFTTITSGWNTLRFLRPVEVTSGDNIWIVIYPQDDGTGTFGVQTTASGDAYLSQSSLLGLTAQTYGIPYRLYGTAKVTDKNSYRFNREGGTNITLVAFNDTMYTINESTHQYDVLYAGLNSAATDYSFTNGDGRVFWVNGYDDLMCWDGSPISNTNLISNPSFTTNTTGWVSSTSPASTLARDTTVFNSTPASLKVTNTSTNARGAQYTMTVGAHKKYKLSFAARTVSGTSSMTVSGNTSTSPSLTTSWQTFNVDILSQTDLTALTFSTASTDFYIDDVTLTYTGIEIIKDTELPILSLMTFHKNRIMGISASDANRIVFSEEPGNPSNSDATQQWYHAWLSVSFIYAPRPKNGSPVTGIISFQDSLSILTQDAKYILSGSDRGNYYMRQSTGSQGALSKRGIINDANYIYFVGHDGLYRFNGSKDEKISVPIQPLFDNCPNKYNITLALWKNQLRVYMASEFSAVNDLCLIFDLNFQEWMLDTKTYVNRAIFYGDADDDDQLVEFNPMNGAAYYAETDYNALGGPIDFDYRLKYNSFGTPAQRKRIKKFFPLIQAVGSSFEVIHGIDKDLADSVRTRTEKLLTGGTQLGTFILDGSVQLTGKIAYKPKKVAVSGNARTFQYRVSRNAVNNQVAFMGVQLTFKEKRL